MTFHEKKEVAAFLRLGRLGIEGRRRVLAFLLEGRTAPEIVERMSYEGLLEDRPVSGNTPAFHAEREMELCSQKGIDLLLYSEPDYPAMLKEIADPPLLLYKKGTLIGEDRNAIAVVGTRHPSFYGRTQAKKFSQELAARGLTIVSGLARGIDQVAHDGALCVPYGRTIAVMGCGLDVVYPKEHESLFQRISERGAILSEYPLGTPPLPENFPRRNRVLSGLSYATFVVEAHSRSGSLITAHQAVEQGREVFALPGSVDQLTSRGTHQLIKEGALLVETPEDILLALADRLKWENPFGAWGAEPSSLPERQADLPLLPAEAVGQVSLSDRKAAAPVSPVLLQEEKSVIVELLKEEGPLAQDEILEFTGLEPATLPARLLNLELSGKIKRNSDGKYSLK